MKPNGSPTHPKETKRLDPMFRGGFRCHNRPPTLHPLIAPCVTSRAKITASISPIQPKETRDWTRYFAANSPPNTEIQHREILGACTVVSLHQSLDTLHPHLAPCVSLWLPNCLLPNSGSPPPFGLTPNYSKAPRSNKPTQARDAPISTSPVSPNGGGRRFFPPLSSLAPQISHPEKLVVRLLSCPRQPQLRLNSPCFSESRRPHKQDQNGEPPFAPVSTLASSLLNSKKLIVGPPIRARRASLTAPERPVFFKSSQAAAARRQTERNTRPTSGGEPNTATVLRPFFRIIPRTSAATTGKERD
jgi:hypothetical protein